jgi:peptide/nickel transport system permease protein
MRYLAGRLIHALLLVAAVSLLAFLLAQLAPGDYFSELRNDPRVSPETVERLRTEAGLDRSILTRYVSWVTSLMHGDFGFSVAYAGPVTPLLASRVGATLLLTLTSTVLAWLLAVPLGIWNATLRGTAWNGAVKAAIAVLLSIPELVLAIALLLLALKTGWFPVGGMSAGGGTWDLVRHMVLPVTVLTLGLLPVLVRHVRAAIVEVMDSPFALNARACGVGRFRLLFRHILPAAMHPLVSLFGLSLGTLLSASLLVEVVMGWPGIGPLFLDAIMARDYAIVLAVVLLSTAFLVVGNLAADLLLYRLDPRIGVN